MTMVTNRVVNDWVKEMAEMTKPDDIVWLDGSKEQLEQIKRIALETGEMIELNQEKLPGCLYYRTNPKDVARDEKRTVICTTKKEDAVQPTTGLLLMRCTPNCGDCSTVP